MARASTHRHKRTVLVWSLYTGQRIVSESSKKIILVLTESVAEMTQIYTVYMIKNF